MDARCSCGKSAIVGLNKRWLCLECFKIGLSFHREIIDKARDTIVEARAAREGGGA